MGVADGIRNDVDREGCNVGYDMGVGINYGVGNDVDDLKELDRLLDNNNEAVGSVDDSKEAVERLYGSAIVVG